MKRLIFILAVVCTVFIGFGSVGFALTDDGYFETGDVIEGYTIVQAPDVSRKCDSYLIVNDNLIYLFNRKAVYVKDFGDYYILQLIDGYYLYQSTTSNMLFNYQYSTAGNVGNSIPKNASTLSNVTLYDFDGNAVFLPPPEVAPTPGPVEVPEGIAAVQIIPQAITGNLVVLIPLGLVVLAILLGVRLLPRLVALFLR